MSIMATRVHAVWDSRGIGKSGLLVDFERVNIGAQRYRFTGMAFDGSDDARSTGIASLERNPGAFEERPDSVGGPALFEPHFGMRVKFVAQRDYLREELRGRIMKGGVHVVYLELHPVSGKGFDIEAHVKVPARFALAHLHRRLPAVQVAAQLVHL